MTGMARIIAVHRTRSYDPFRRSQLHARRRSAQDSDSIWTLTLRWTLTLYPLFAKPPTMMVSPLRSAATWLWFLTWKHWDKRSLATGQSLSTVCGAPMRHGYVPPLLPYYDGALIHFGARVQRAWPCVSLHSFAPPVFLKAGAWRCAPGDRGGTICSGHLKCRRLDQDHMECQTSIART